MKKVIYDNNSSKLVGNVISGVIELKSYVDGEEVGTIYLNNEEAEELSTFINQLAKRPVQRIHCEFCKLDFPVDEIESISAEDLGLNVSGSYCLCKGCIQGVRDDVQDGYLP